jgi:hypothetical protein
MTMSEQWIVFRASWRAASHAAILLLLLCGSATANSGAAQAGLKRRSVVKKEPEPIVTNEIRLVDSAGRTRMLLSTKSGLPVVQLVNDKGTPGLSASLDVAGHGSLRLHNPADGAPDAVIEIDDKGAHVRFDRSGGTSAYLFLSNAGESGVVLIDNRGKRRLNMLVKEDGSSTIERFDDQGKPLP